MMRTRTLNLYLLRLVRILVLAALVVPVALLAPAQPAHADTCTVTTDADSGPGSLRGAIANPMCTTIGFDGDYTILLASTLAIGRSVTIDGAGHGVTISGNDAVRVFNVWGSATTFRLKNLTVSHGMSSDGSGINTNAGLVDVVNVTFSDNYASWAGGAIYVAADSCWNGGILFVTNCVFLNNSASGGGGAIAGWPENGMSEGPSHTTVINSTFSGNSAGSMYSAGTLWAYGTSTLTLKNTIVVGDSTWYVCNGVSDGGGNLAWDQGGPNCPGINVDPLFVDAANGDLHLQPGSPAVDAGDQALLPAGVDVDLDGNPRVVGADVDIGAYELQNAPPVANAGGPYLGAVNTDIQLDGSGSYDPEDDELTYMWDFGDGNTGTEAAPPHNYAVPGIYDVCLTVNDGALDSDPACTIAVVYDPEGGFVTGGGWIDSPAGAYKPDETLSGQATFGFVSKYKKGASVPTGNTEFQFHVAAFDFHSTNYDWLVVNQAGTNAQFKGSGTVNGALAPDGNAYRFMLWATDGAPDTFRIKIWWEDDGVETDVYDNGVNQAIGGGSIVVHTK